MASESLGPLVNERVPSTLSMSVRSRKIDWRERLEQRIVAARWRMMGEKEEYKVMEANWWAGLKRVIRLQ